SGRPSPGRGALAGAWYLRRIRLSDEVDDESWRETIGDEPVTGPRVSGKPPTKHRPPLRVVDSEDVGPDILCGAAIHKTTEAMLQVLADRDVELFKRAGALCHVIRVAKEDEIAGVPEGSPVVRDAPASWLANRVSRFAHCIKRTTRKGQQSAISCQPPPNA